VVLGVDRVLGDVHEIEMRDAKSKESEGRSGPPELPVILRTL
jgi:hypothetical protein